MLKSSRPGRAYVHSVAIQDTRDRPHQSMLMRQIELLVRIPVGADRICWASVQLPKLHCWTVTRHSRIYEWGGLHIGMYHGIARYHSW